jgi:hypothetical protein
MVRKLKWIFFFALICFASSCYYYDKEELLYPGGNDCPTVAHSFATEVNPIIQTKCAFASDCHGAGSTTSGGPFTSYDLIKAKATDIRFQTTHGFMPKTGSLTSAELKTITCWVDAGAPNN